jgi:signal transduction histidine kinase
VIREREIDRMKTEFVSMVSHELRTPLTSIKGFVDLLREGDAGDLSNEQMDFLTIVATNTDRLVALINDLLDISRIESGKVELTRTELDLRQSIQTAAATLRPLIEAKQQRLALDVPDHLVVSADADRVTQILTNLLSNAHKYTPPDHDISIVAEPVTDGVRVDVTDTGIGLSRAEQAKLFNRFYRSTNQATRDTEGTGLGLAITRSLVELHGGTISVRSAPGRGSTFSFTLPREAPSPYPTE